VAAVRSTRGSPIVALIDDTPTSAFQYTTVLFLAVDNRLHLHRRALGRRLLLPIGLTLLLATAACSSDSSNGDAGSDDSTPGAEQALPAEFADLPGADGVTVNEDGVDPLPPLPDDLALPIVFVHGFAGSAQQYESQAMRFVANGYPQERIVAFDHDGAGVDIAGYADGVDELIDEVLAQFGTEQVYLVGHSRGTSVSSTYLSDPARAAKVAKYVAIDGAPCPDVVPCVAPTQENNPGQSHVEVATSAESFAMQYGFLVGEAPEVVDVVPQRDPVVISGRAVNFPANTGRDATLDVWEIDAGTGQRVGDMPHATFALDDEGGFGPLVVQSGAHYEYLLSTDESPVQHHLYLQPYVRDSSLVRLLSSEPDGNTRANTNTGDGHSSIIAIRMREWYAADDPDLDGDERDILEITTQGAGGDEQTVNAVVPLVGNGAIALHIHDDAATPGETTLAGLPYFSEQPFQNGIDVFMPASDAADATISVTNIPRGDTERPQTLNVPNWPSSGHSVSLVFTDYPVD
jgi:pimeloyl-ACP methyl ester carboxylesterase